jgi:ribosomal protein S12 methylthiotransferase accessory factor
VAETIRAPGHRLFLHDIRADIQVPTIMATIVMRDGLVAGKLHGDDLTRASGWAAHPDPETAVQMALLEASQTVISHIAGAREDLTLHARSLGRHERSDCRRDAAFQNEFDASGEALSFSTISGFTSPDAGADVRWLVERLNEAGCDEILAMDYSTAAIVPVRVVRVVVPGLETINAFHTGRRARRALLADLLPTPRAADASRSVP